MIARALLLVGSPRGKGSTSHAIGAYMTDRLREKGILVETEFATYATRSEEGIQKLLSAVDAADLIVLASPLYIDSLPAPAIRAMEIISDHRKVRQKKQALMAIINCGFPEPQHNLLAADICRKFASECGMAWLGSARIGSGPGINGRPLNEAGGIAAKLIKGLDQAADLLAEGTPLTPGVEKALSVPLMPLPVARLMVRSGLSSILWNGQAKANGVRDRMYDRPYEH